MSATQRENLHLPDAAARFPVDWKWHRLEDVCNGIFDCHHSTPKLAAQGPFVIRTQDIITGTLNLRNAGRVSEETYQVRISRAEPAQGDILYSREGTYFGIAAEVPPNTRLCLGQRMVLIKCDPDVVNSRFATYWLNSGIMSNHIHKFRDGSVAEHINMSTIRALPIPIPPLSEQHAIAGILGSLDDKIGLNRRMSETLEEIARTIFKSWFIDFDPVYAKSRGEQPPGMDAATAALFPDEFVGSVLGPIPTGWWVSELGELVSLNKGLSYKGDFLATSGMPMVNLGCFGGNGLFKHDNMKFYTGGFKERHLVKSGDIVVANTDMTQQRIVLGSPAIVPSYDGFDDFLITHHIYALRLKNSPELLRLFVFYSLLQQSFRERAIGFATGTTVLALPQDAMLELKIVLPPLVVVEQFNAIIQPLRQLIEENEHQSQALMKTRDVLLPKLISGEVRVQEMLDNYKESIA